MLSALAPALQIPFPLLYFWLLNMTFMALMRHLFEDNGMWYGTPSASKSARVFFIKQKQTLTAIGG
jgi:hypothetical protein